jgi:hypothetical protein
MFPLPLKLRNSRQLLIVGIGIFLCGGVRRFLQNYQELFHLSSSFVVLSFST